MMSLVMWSASCPIHLPRRARLEVWLHPVGSPRTVVVSYEWPIGPVQHSSSMSTHLVGINGATYRHALLAMMAQVSSASVNYVRALETRMPIRIAWSAKPFFIFEARGPLVTVGCVAALEPSPAERQGPEP
jgi:hypothetical protein